LNKYEGEHQVDDDGLEFADLNYDCVEEDFIGNMWIVVVVYHH
jgi:hypothetical protein